MQRIVVIVNREINGVEICGGVAGEGPWGHDVSGGKSCSPGAPRAMHRDSAEPSIRRDFAQLKTSEIKRDCWSRVRTRQPTPRCWRGGVSSDIGASESVISVLIKGLDQATGRGEICRFLHSASGLYTLALSFYD